MSALPMGDERMIKVFASYAYADFDIVKGVLAELKRAGIDAAYPQDEEVDEDYDEAVEVAEDFEESIAQSIKEAEHVIVFWSEAAARSVWVQGEVRMAIILAWSEGRLILALLDRTELPSGLRDLEAVDLSTDRDQGIKRIAELVLSDRVSSGVDHSLRRRAYADSVSQEDPAWHYPSWQKRWTGWILPTAILVLFAALLGGLGYSVWNDLQHLSEWRPPNEEIADHSYILRGVVLTAALLVVLTVYYIYRRRSLVRRSISFRYSQRIEFPPDPHQVFVSYSHNDWNTVDGIVRQIEGFGYKVWVDRQDKSSGRYAGAIVRAIRSCKVVALMASRNSFSSDHVVREVYVAGDSKIPFISVQLDQSEFPDDFVYFLSGFPRTAPPIQPEWLKAQLSRYVV
jgi:hypothetical protein